MPQPNPAHTLLCPLPQPAHLAIPNAAPCTSQPQLNSALLPHISTLALTSVLTLPKLQPASALRHFSSSSALPFTPYIPPQHFKFHVHRHFHFSNSWTHCGQPHIENKSREPTQKRFPPPATQSANLGGGSENPLNYIPAFGLKNMLGFLPKSARHFSHASGNLIRSTLFIKL